MRPAGGSERHRGPENACGYLRSGLRRKGDAGTLRGGGAGSEGPDRSSVMSEGKSSSQRLFSLKSTGRKTPAVLLSSKDEAMRWNTGSTCVGGG